MTVRRTGEPKLRLESHWKTRSYKEAEFTKLVCREPRFSLIDMFTFDYDVNQRQRDVQNRLDRVFVLKRR